MPATRSKKEALVQPLPAATKRKRSQSVETTTTSVAADQEPAQKRKKAAKAAAPVPQTRRTTRASSRAASVVSDAESTAPAPARRTTRATSRATSQITEEQPIIMEEPDEDDEEEMAPPLPWTTNVWGSIEGPEDREPGEYPWQAWKPKTMRDHLFQIDLMNRMKAAKAERERQEEEAREEEERQRIAQEELDKEEEERSNQARTPLQEQAQPQPQNSAMDNHTPHTAATPQAMQTPKTGFFSRLTGACTPFNGLRLWGTTPARQTTQQQQPQASQATPAPLQQPQHDAQPHQTSQASSVSRPQQTNNPQPTSQRATPARLSRRSQQPHQAASQATPAPQPTPHTQHLGAISLGTQEQTDTPARRSQHFLQPQASPAPQPIPHTQHLGAISLGFQEHTNTPIERPTIKRKRSAIEDTGLDTISESPETSGLLAMATPSRPSADLSNGGFIPRATPHPAATPVTVQRRRTVAKVRAQQQAKLNALTPTFQRYAPTPPKDPNADRRVLRLREIEGLKARQKQNEENIARLEAEQQADRPRKTKRVKVDHLKEIPHNRPGDSEGTFRVPDWDSDDEMEVDEDAELIDNLFGKNEEGDKEMTEAAPETTRSFAPIVAATQAFAPAVATGPAAAEKATSSTPELIADSPGSSDSDFELEWPTLPPREGGLDAVLAGDKEAEECFERGFEQWLKTGEVLADF